MQVEVHLYAAQRNHKCHKCAVASNTVENKYVFKWAFKVVSDSPVSRRLNGSSFHARGPAAAKDRSPKVLFYVAQSRHVARRTARISVRNRQPADSRRQGNPAPSPTVHGRRDSLACTGYVAAQVASAPAAVLE